MTFLSFGVTRTGLFSRRNGSFTNISLLFSECAELSFLLFSSLFSELSGLGGQEQGTTGPVKRVEGQEAAVTTFTTFNSY